MKNIQELVDIVVDPMITFIRKQCVETTSTNDQALIQAFLRIWGTLLKNFEDSSYTENLDKRQAVSTVDNMFLFSIIWSICITCNSEFRRPIDNYLKAICDGSIEGLEKFQGNKKIIPSQFDRGLIFDYCYDPAANAWKHWMADVDKDTIDDFGANAKVQEIIVTTVDTVRYSYV